MKAKPVQRAILQCGVGMPQSPVQGGAECATVQFAVVVKNRSSPVFAPGRRLLAASLYCLIGVAAAIALALAEPSLGMRYRVDDAGAGIVVSGTNQSSPLPAGARILSMTGDDGAVFVPGALDIVEEPDFIDEYADMRRFYDRQSQAASLLAQRHVGITWRQGDAQPQTVNVSPRPRTLADLPGLFWWQLGVGTLCCLIGVWVSVLRPGEIGARLLAGTALVFPLAAYAAAVYSGRELALDSHVLRGLSFVNHIGTLGFGALLVLLLLSYPQRLVGRLGAWLWIVGIGIWLLVDQMQWAPDQNWGIRVPVMLQMLLAIAAGIGQWRRAARQPDRRAALRWMLLATLVGCGLFVFTTVGSKLLGLFPPLSQGAAFGYFLIMYVGLALGVGRYRLFDLDRWAYRILLWVFGAVAVVVVDFLLVWSLQADKTISLGVAIVLAGWVYFPLRQWLWRVALAGSDIKPEDALPRVLDIALAPAIARETKWGALWEDMFRPTHRMAANGTVAGLHDDGLALQVPACAGMGGMRLELADRGRRLFTRRDVAQVDSICRLMEHAAASRQAFERGTHEERQRIAREMHDNLGARLLAALHTRDGERRDSLLRDTVRDLRSIVHGLAAADTRAGEWLADLRHETSERLDAAGITLDWEGDIDLENVVLPAVHAGHLRAALREAVTNAIRHAGASRVVVRLRLDGPVRIALEVTDDGRGFEPESVVPGLGLPNLRARIAELGGTVGWRRAGAGGTTLSIAIPLAA